MKTKTLVDSHCINVPLKNVAFCNNTAQKVKFPIKDFFSTCEQIRSFLWALSHLLKKPSMGSFLFCPA